MFEQELAEYERDGAYTAIQEVLCYLSEVESRAGRWAEAARHAAAGMENLVESGRQLRSGQMFHFPAALAEAHVGKVEDARKSAMEGVRLGLTICYDLRFPELYRQLAVAGARVLLVPAAFTTHTGRDHWEVLLRARAIENQCYVIAAGQWGDHDPGRSTFGHSMVIDPWGTVIAQAVDGTGVVVADLDLERVERIRRELPSLANRRL